MLLVACWHKLKHTTLRRKARRKTNKVNRVHSDMESAWTVATKEEQCKLQQKQCNSHHNKSTSEPTSLGCTLHHSKGRLKSPLAILGNLFCALLHIDTIRQTSIGWTGWENWSAGFYCVSFQLCQFLHLSHCKNHQCQHKRGRGTVWLHRTNSLGDNINLTQFKTIYSGHCLSMSPNATDLPSFQCQLTISPWRPISIWYECRNLGTRTGKLDPPNLCSPQENTWQSAKLSIFSSFSCFWPTPFTASISPKKPHGLQLYTMQRLHNYFLLATHSWQMNLCGREDWV